MVRMTKTPFHVFFWLLPIVENRLHCVGKLLDQISHLLRLSRFLLTFITVYEISDLLDHSD